MSTSLYTATDNLDTETACGYQPHTLRTYTVWPHTATYIADIHRVITHSHIHCGHVQAPSVHSHSVDTQSHTHQRYSVDRQYRYTKPDSTNTVWADNIGTQSQTVRIHSHSVDTSADSVGTPTDSLCGHQQTDFVDSPPDSVDSSTDSVDTSTDGVNTPTDSVDTPTDQTVWTL